MSCSWRMKSDRYTGTRYECRPIRRVTGCRDDALRASQKLTPRLLSWPRTKPLIFFILQRMWIVKDSAPIARFFAVVCMCNAPSRSYRRYYRGIKEKRSRYLGSSWILVINGLKFPCYYLHSDRDNLGILP